MKAYLMCLLPVLLMTLVPALIGLSDPLDMGELFTTQAFGGIGLIVGATIGGILLKRNPRPKPAEKLIQGPFGGACLAVFGTVGPVVVIIQLIHGPIELDKHDVWESKDYVKVRGTPDLSEVWEVDDGRAYRYPLVDFNKALLIQTSSEPTMTEQEFIGSLELLIVGGLVDDNLFVAKYTQKNMVRGNFYLLKVYPFLATTQYAMLLSGIVFLALLFVFVKRQGYGTTAGG